MIWIWTALALAAPLDVPPCASGDAVACMQQAAEARAERPEEAARLATIACEAGLGDGCTLVGALSQAGSLGPGAVDAALGHFQRGCEAGSGPGCSRAVALLLPSRATEAAELLEKACGTGIATACEDLGTLYARGTGLPQSDDQAIALYRQACELPAAACRQLGVRTVEGRGLPKDVTAGLGLLEGTCRSGSAQTCRQLVTYLTNPDIVPEDLGRIAGARQDGCVAGDAWSCAGLGFQVYEGKGLPKDEAMALRLLEKGCTGGEAAACGGIGFHHREAGRPDEAKPWFAKACEAGLDRACVDLVQLNNEAQ